MQTRSASSATGKRNVRYKPQEMRFTCCLPLALRELALLEALWLCIGLKSTKFPATSELGGLLWRSGVGCPVCSPYKLQLSLCPCSPLPSAGPVGPTADSEQGREEGTTLAVGLGTRSPECDFYGILPLTGHGTLGQFHEHCGPQFPCL